MNKQQFAQCKKMLDQFGAEASCHQLIKKAADVISRMEALQFADNNKEQAKAEMILHFELAELQIALDLAKLVFDLKNYNSAYATKLKHYLEKERL